MRNNTYDLLRRTFAVLAFASAATSGSAASGPIIVDDGTSLTTVCPSWTTFAPSASGGIVIKCGGAVPPPVVPAGTFTLYGPSTIDASKNEYAWFSVARAASAGSTAGAVTLSLSVTGGCTLSPSSVSFADNSGDGSYQAFGVIAPKDATGKIYNTTCVVSLDQSMLTYGVSLGGPKTVSIVNGTGSPPKTCAAPPPNAVTFPLHYAGNDIVFLQSGQIGYSLLPSFASWGGPPASGSAKIALAITTASPNPGSYEISIGPCPGVIDTTGGTPPAGGSVGTCYKSGVASQSLFTQTWFEAPGPNPSTTDATANTYKICEAYASSGPWYVNIRYNFSAAGSAAYAVQWLWDFYTP